MLVYQNYNTINILNAMHIVGWFYWMNVSIMIMLLVSMATACHQCNLTVDLWRQVQPKHVKEAFRLLNKSIIRVEQPDVHLEEEDDEEMDEDEEVAMETGQYKHYSQIYIILSFFHFTHFEITIFLMENLNGPR